MIELDEHQKLAVEQLKTGSILSGGVGSGKSRTALAYYFTKECGGLIDGMSHGYTTDYIPMTKEKDLYIITTAQKRDKLEWEAECVPFLLNTKIADNLDYPDYKCKVVVDSWNNIGKYVTVEDAFFIFDEQRVVGYGAWVQAFLKITKRNHWILLSATPGDRWMDYLPVFIANGFFTNKREFENRHVVYNPYVKFRKVQRYLDEARLRRFRDSILVPMESDKSTVAHDESIDCSYDKEMYRFLMKERWNPITEEPIENISALCYLLRKVVNTDVSRECAVLELTEQHPKAIIFYNFDYELEILEELPYIEGTVIAEWNGHRHEPVPTADRWVYLVQYTAGAEGWNCIETDTIIFYSQNYSYKIMVQAAGRIDRRNTPFTDLYYYHLRSKAPIDLGIREALKRKKKFNETKFMEPAAHRGYNRAS